MFFRHYAKNAELAETHVLLQKYNVFWWYSGSKNEQHMENACSKSMLEKRSEITCHLVQKWTPKGHLKRSKTYLFRHIFACYVWHAFEIVFGSKMNGKWVQQGVQNVTKNHEKSIPSPGCNFGAIWGRFWTDFLWFLGGVLVDFRFIWDRFSIEFDTMFTRILGQTYCAAVNIRQQQQQQCLGNCRVTDSSSRSVSSSSSSSSSDSSSSRSSKLQASKQASQQASKQASRQK